MVLVVCRLCRGRVEVEPGATEARCPKCGGRVPADLLPTAVPPAPSSAPLACPTCLRLLRLPGPVSACPYCGGLLASAEAERLAGILDGLEARLAGQLLEGHPAAELAAGLANQGIAQDRAWEFLDRLLSELPFERHPAWKAGRPVPPPPACDACGVSGGSLAAFEADWRIQPEELQRYRSGWGGFEGDFVKRGHYTRQALYYLCPGCSKALRTPGFASGYPHRFGFRIERFRKLDRL